MGCCFSCVANRSICCVRVTLCILCLLVCLGPILLLIGIGMYFVPYYAVRYDPQVYEYNVLAARFENGARNTMQSVRVEASSAVPLLGTLGVYHDLNIGSRIPPLQGILYGVATTRSVAHFGEAGALLGGMTGYYQFRVTGGALTSSQIVPIDAPGNTLASSPVICTWADECTGVNLDFCVEGFNTYSGANTCKRGATCGTCQGRMFLLQICALVMTEAGLFTPALQQGCYFPFTVSAGDYTSPTPLKEVAVQFMHQNDPYVLLQTVTRGTNDLSVSFVLYSVIQDIGSVVAIGAAFIIIVTILCLCTICYNQSGRRNAQIAWEKFLGAEDPKARAERIRQEKMEKEMKAMKKQSPMVNNGKMDSPKASTAPFVSSNPIQNLQQGGPVNSPQAYPAPMQSYPQKQPMYAPQAQAYSQPQANMYAPQPPQMYSSQQPIYMPAQQQSYPQQGNLGLRPMGY